MRWYQGTRRMSPGRQHQGFSGCDGSTLKNASVLFPSACALVSPSASSIFYLLYPVSLFLPPLCVVYLLYICFLTISLLLCICIYRRSSTMLYEAKNSKSRCLIQSSCPVGRGEFSPGGHILIKKGKSQSPLYLLKHLSFCFCQPL